MKQIITEEDVKNLFGKFILQVNVKEPDVVVQEANWNFLKEKRISFVCGLTWAGFYYVHQVFQDHAAFVEYWNHYSPNDRDARFHRLLTNKEIDFVCKKLKEENY